MANPGTNPDNPVVSSLADGFNEPEAEIVSFYAPVASVYGFTLLPHYPPAMRTSMEMGPEASHGWGPPFEDVSGAPINGGVGTPQGPAPFKSRIRYKPGGSRAITRGHDVNPFQYGPGQDIDKAVPSVTIDWISADGKDVLQWAGPKSRYGPQNVNPSGHFRSPFFHGDVKWEYENGPTMGFFFDSEEIVAGGVLPVPYTRMRTGEPGDGGTNDFYYLYQRYLWHNGRVVGISPQTTHPEPPGEVGKPECLYGACVRSCPPAEEFYTLLGRLDEYQKKVENEEVDKWIVIATHEWWVEEATTGRTAYIADRVYTKRLQDALAQHNRALVSGASPLNGAVADEELLANLSTEIGDAATPAEKAAAVNAYLAEYGKWHLLGERLAPLDTGPVPETGYRVWDSSDWFKWFGESYTFAPWLFNQSGTEAVSTRFVNDRAEPQYATGSMAIKIIDVVMGAGPLDGAVFGTKRDADYYSTSLSGGVLTGKWFVAADFKGDVFVDGYLDVVHRDMTFDAVYTLVLPWSSAFSFVGVEAGGFWRGLGVAALDLRYDTALLTTAEFSADWTEATYEDFLVTAAGAETVYSHTRPPGVSQPEAWGMRSPTGGGLSSLKHSHPSIYSNGTSVRFASQDTYVISHHMGKTAFTWPGDTFFLTQGEELLDDFDKTFDIVGSRRFLNRIVVDGVDAGDLFSLLELDQVAGVAMDPAAVSFCSVDLA